MSKDLAMHVTAPIVARNHTRGVSTLVKCFIVLGILALVLITAFHLLFEQEKSKSITKRERSDQELATKPAWSFTNLSKDFVEGDKIEDEQHKEIKRPPFQGKETLKMKKSRSGEFKKYQSIPAGNHFSTEIETATENTGATGNAEADSVIAHSIQIDPDFLLQEGVYIPCSLTTRFVSEVAGWIQCMINQDIYSASGKVKLIERGTKAIGMYQSGMLQNGMARMDVIWGKLLTPDHKRINLADTQVVGSLGEAGIDGRVNSHFAQRFGGALMISTLKDVIGYATEKYSKGSKRDTININTYENTKDGFTSIADKMLESSVNIPPTIYKKQGDIVGILVGKDIDFSKIYKLKVNYAD